MRPQENRLDSPERPRLGQAAAEDAVGSWVFGGHFCQECDPAPGKWGAYK